MKEILCNSAYFGVTVSLIGYGVGIMLKKKFKYAFLNPLLISIIFVIGVVLLCGEYLFCGDTLFAGSIGRTDLEGGSSAQMAESLRKLAKLPIPRGTQVLPGHGEFSTFGDELDNNYFIRSAVRGNNDLF